MTRYPDSDPNNGMALACLFTMDALFRANGVDTDTAWRLAKAAQLNETSEQETVQHGQV